MKSSKTLLTKIVGVFTVGLFARFGHQLEHWFDQRFGTRSVSKKGLNRDSSFDRSWFGILLGSEQATLRAYARQTFGRTRNRTYLYQLLMVSLDFGDGYVLQILLYANLQTTVNHQWETTSLSESIFAKLIHLGQVSCSGLSDLALINHADNKVAIPKFIHDPWYHVGKY